MKSECVNCGLEAGATNFDDFTYVDGHFFCQNCSPDADTWCKLCEREGVDTESHHLIPKSEGGTHQHTVRICVSCHRKIHSLFTNKELSNHLNSIERLKKHRRIKEYIQWIRKENRHRASFKESNRKKRVKNTNTHNRARMEIEPMN